MVCASKQSARPRQRRIPSEELAEQISLVLLVGSLIDKAVCIGAIIVEDAGAEAKSVITIAAASIPLQVVTASLLQCVHINSGSARDNVASRLGSS